MENATIADVFDEMAQLLEFRGENPFRIRAYRNGAKAIRDLDESVASILKDDSRDLAKIPGIGKTLVEKTQTLLSEGQLPQLEKLRQEIPDVVIEMSRIPGLGAKKAARLQQELELEQLPGAERSLATHLFDLCIGHFGHAPSIGRHVQTSTNRANIRWEGSRWRSLR